MAIEVKLKRWGNSMAVIVPNEIVEKQRLKENDKILVQIGRKADISHIFGSLKSKRKLSGQEFKNSVRKEWSK